ncbi:hypothetical protein GCL60_05465 [Silvanigrella paludirubra]|uniref:Uncharacterized protein n=1 Tax=Silvanigrella paludirubra TaxID=2499159 RepID=A0A6N6VTQ6_9BACT|nr:hypothetical protein [Silvanigrella paludirubra]KAB8039710.1 hypothetical protein GCL60_05465 [Silvanigrella paludirubra]
MKKCLFVIIIIFKGCVSFPTSNGKPPKIFCITNNMLSSYKVNYPSGERKEGVVESTNDQFRRGDIYYEDDNSMKLEVGKKYNIPTFTEEVENNFHVFEIHLIEAPLSNVYISSNYISFNINSTIKYPYLELITKNSDKCFIIEKKISSDKTMDIYFVNFNKPIFSYSYKISVPNCYKYKKNTRRIISENSSSSSSSSSVYANQVNQYGFVSGFGGSSQYENGKTYKFDTEEISLCK